MTESKYIVGAIFEAPRGAFLEKRYGELRITFNDRKDERARELVDLEGTRFLIEEIIPASPPSGIMGSIPGPVQAIVSRVGANDTYRPSSPKVKVDIEGEWSSDNLLGKRATIVSHLIRTFA